MTPLFVDPIPAWRFARLQRWAWTEHPAAIAVPPRELRLLLEAYEAQHPEVAA